jgi:hypothetical protein
MVFSVIAGSALKCMISEVPITVTSDDRKTTVVLLYDGKLLIYGKGSSHPRHVGRWSEFGHHQELYVNRDASTIVVLDRYDGAEIFDHAGRRISFIDPAKSLSAAELTNTPGKWACHVEGTWLTDPKLKFTVEGLSFQIYNGRRIHVSTFD